MSCRDRDDSPSPGPDEHPSGEQISQVLEKIDKELQSMSAKPVEPPQQSRRERRTPPSQSRRDTPTSQSMRREVASSQHSTRSQSTKKPLKVISLQQYNIRKLY